MGQTTNHYQIVQKVSETDTVLLHPETDAEVVKLNGGTAGLDAGNVQSAFGEVSEKITVLSGDVVKGVKGQAEEAFRKGEVILTPANIGAEPSGTVASHNTDGAAHADIRKSVSTAQSKADEAYALAEGRSKAVSFETAEAMTAALKAAEKTAYKVGDNIYIKAADVPDYWVSAVLEENTGTYGYFELSILETAKVDLSAYQTKSDESLTTTAKTVVGAIGEVKTTADGAQTKATTNEGKIADIVSGTTKVGKAAAADSATAAGSADKWATPRTLGVKVNSGVKNDGSAQIVGSGSQAVDGSADKTVEVSLGDSGVEAGTYSALKVNAKGIAVAGGQMIEIGSVGQSEPSASLATGGLFFKQI